MAFLIALFSLFGISFTLWGGIGLLRYYSEFLQRLVTNTPRLPSSFDTDRFEKRFSIIPVSRSAMHSLRNPSPRLSRFDTVVTLGFPTAHITRKLSNDFPELFQDARVLNIDYHQENERFGDLDFLTNDLSSLSSLVYLLLKEGDAPLPSQLITAFLGGALRSVRTFYTNHIPTQNTLHVVHDLLRSGALMTELRTLGVRGDHAHPPAAHHQFSVTTSLSAQRVRDFFTRSRRIVLILGESDNWDTLGAASGIAHMLRGLEKNVSILVPPDFHRVPALYLRTLIPHLPIPRNTVVNLAFQDSSLHELQLGKVPRTRLIEDHEVAALIAAHNEEATIEKTIQSLKRIIPSRNIYVGSDGSSDSTVTLVHRLGCNVLDIQPNRGKAGALQHTIDHFKLTKHYRALIIIDADSEVQPDYLRNALPLFEDPRIAAIAVHATTKWYKHWPPKWDMIFPAYRVRFYRILQAVMKFGQSWKYTNVMSIVPGFASIYRTSVLPFIKIDAPGLVIEDFNMTFELHHKKLGLVGYSPRVIGITDDPHSFSDYRKQIRRWHLGFWQTVRRHGIWPSFFWLSLSVLTLEIIFFSIFLLATPFLFLWFLFTSFEPIMLSFLPSTLSRLTFLDLLVGFFLVDYLSTAIVAFVERKPILLLYGFTFPFIRFIDAAMFLYTLPLAFLVKSKGTWVSPKRATSLKTR